MTGIAWEGERRQDFQGEEGVVPERSEMENLAVSTVVPGAGRAAASMSLLETQNVRSLCSVSQNLLLGKTLSWCICILKTKKPG